MTETSDRTPSHLPGTGIQFPIGARKDQHLLRLLNCDSSFRPCDTLRSEPKRPKKIEQDARHFFAVRFLTEEVRIFTPKERRSVAHFLLRSLRLLKRPKWGLGLR